jgi:DNA-binding XRE family transcriptional regulator
MDSPHPPDGADLSSQRITGRFRTKDFPVGTVFGHWIVLGRAPSRYHHSMWECRCLGCSKVAVVDGSHLRRGTSTYCSCRPRRQLPFDRFNARHMPEPNSGCWIWLGAVSHHGYGKINVDGRTLRAHRYSWELANGPIPDGMCVLHQCDNPLCVNPDHLFLGTSQDNMDDRDRKGRQARGEANGTAKLTAQQAQEIRVSSLLQRELAAIYGVSRKTIINIQTGKGWAWLANETAPSIAFTRPTTKPQLPRPQEQERK